MCITAILLDLFAAHAFIMLSKEVAYLYSIDNSKCTQIVCGRVEKGNRGVEKTLNSQCVT